MEDRRVLAGLATHPWHAPFDAVARQLVPGENLLAALNRLAARSPHLTSAGAPPIRFVTEPAGRRAGAAQYEATILETGRVTTRAGRHDLFNALAWLAFPELKRLLNRCLAQEWSAAPERPRRGAVGDALTLLDEQGAIFVSDRADLRAALRAHDWSTLFGTDFHRHCRVLVVGHGLADKLTRPYKAITAHALVLECAPHRLLESGRATWDRAAARHVARLHAARTFTPAALEPLPLAGVPGWWPGQDAAFYADTAVFRAARQRPRRPVSQDSSSRQAWIPLGGRCSDK